MSRPLPAIIETDKPSVRQWLSFKIADRAIDQARRNCPVMIDLQKADNATAEATALKAAFIDGWNKALEELYAVGESGVPTAPAPLYLGEDK